MKHFEVVQWADYARGLTGPPELTRMEEHLASGCQRCQSVAGLFDRVVRVTHGAPDYEAPESEVHCAKAIFVLQQPERVELLPRVRSRLIYDSFREPLPAGVRAQHRISRQTVYQAGDYALDLWMEHERGSARVNLVGQVANQKEPNWPMAGIPIVLLSQNRVIAQTLSNQFGEFHLDYLPQRHLRLCVPVQGRSNPPHHLKS